MLTIGYWLTLVDVFLRLSRVHDVFAAGLHLPAILMAIGGGVLLLSGKFVTILTTKLGRLMTLFTTLTLLSIGVSVWPGGAYSHFLSTWVPSIVTFAFIVAFIRSSAQVRVLALLVGCCVALIAVIGIGQGQMVAGERTAVENLAFGNSNDLAAILLFGCPFCVWALMTKTGAVPVRILLAVGLALSVIVLVRTGSRGGMLTLGVLVLYALFRLSAAKRARLILAAALLIPIGISIMPRSLLTRYTTMFATAARADPMSRDAGGSENDEVVAQSAALSANTRFHLLMRSIDVTFANPVLGVGPGMFMVAENEIALAAGHSRGAWKVSHNMYTQISSELGFIALIVYLLMVRHCWKTFDHAERSISEKFTFSRELRRLAFVLKLAAIAFLAMGATLSIAYGPFIVILCGFATALERVTFAAGRAAPVQVQQAAGDEPAREPALTPAAARY